MQTQCPHCDTQFRITESQVNTADGFVRCGVCKEVFNTINVASSHEQQTSSLDTDAITDKTVTGDIEQELSASDELIADDFTLDEISTDNLIDEASPASAINQQEKDEFDFFVEDDLASPGSVVPEEFRDNSPAISFSNLLWSAGTLLLVSTLFIEYIWFNRHQLNQLSELQIWRDKLCLQVDCSNIAVRDPKNIELVSRNVYSHPHEKDALMVAITLKNNAEFAQPYPIMQIDFSDIRGGTVAARRFLPREYLRINPEKINLLQSGDKLSFSMEIADPGKQAKTYEFNFL